VRNYRYPNAIPPLGTPMVDANGQPSDVWRRYFEAITTQLGGQGGDDFFALNLQQTIMDGVNERQERLEADLVGRVNSAEATSAGVSDRLDALAAEISTLANGVDVQGLGVLAGRDSVGRDITASDFAGVVARANDATADWVKSAVSSPTKAASDYETLSLTTGDFTVRPGDRIEVYISYKNQGIRDMYEHFSHQEQVLLLSSGGTTLATLNDDVYPAWSSANTGYVPSSWSGEINIRHTDSFIQDVPDPLTGSWPSNGQVKVRLLLTPSTAASGGGADCIAGGTFNGANVKTYFKCVNRNIIVRVIPQEITDLVG